MTDMKDLLGVMDPNLLGQLVAKAQKPEEFIQKKDPRRRGLRGTVPVQMSQMQSPTGGIARTR
jgi:hypothetical protein